MKDKKQLSPEETAYFEIQADFGITKHIGGLAATKELIKLSHIKRGKYVLEVGCGVGITACYIAKKIGSRVVGVDISEKMIEKSKERAKREGLEDKVEFKVADARGLPFKDANFDAVIAESVVAFVEDKQRAVNECVRVVKPRGFVGFNEATWIKTPPKELAGYMSRIARAELLNSAGWKKLLESAGITEIKVRTYKIKVLNEMVEQIRRLDAREYLRAWYRFFSRLILSPAYRKFAKEALTVPKSIFKFLEYVGYGVYVGRKEKK